MNNLDDDGIQGGEDVDAGTTHPRYTSKLYLGILFAIVLAIGFAGGLRVGAATTSDIISSIPLLGDGLSAKPDQNVNFTDFWKVYNVLNDRFVETHASTTIPDVKAKQWGAIQGLTSSYKDPYTVFFPPEEAKTFQDDIAGNFGGIGVEIGLSKESILTVIAPLKGTPGERAGMLAGDLILTIDGKSTEGIGTDEAVKRIQGPKGTTVTFTLYREGKNVEVSVVRDTIQVPTIDNSLDSKTGVYTIALYQFTANSANLFDKAIADFKNSGSKKLILDLRGNPGGYLDAAVAMAGHFLPKGAVVVTEDYKGKEDNKIHRSEGVGSIPEDVKMVVLINQGSASASEILAGALQDTKKATLIGNRSFGKGSVQELIDVNGGSLKITIARWLTPAGRSISDGGLTPDIKVDRTAADFEAKRDPQMERAVIFLATGK